MEKKTRITMKSLFLINESGILTWLTALKPPKITVDVAWKARKLEARLTPEIKLAYEAKNALFTDENSYERCAKCSKTLAPENPTSTEERKCPGCGTVIGRDGSGFQKAIKVECMEQFNRDAEPFLDKYVEIDEEPMRLSDFKNAEPSGNDFRNMGPLLAENDSLDKKTVVEFHDKHQKNPKGGRAVGA